MRVLMVIGRYRPRIGGAEIQAERLARALVQKGIAVEILTGRERGLERQEQRDGVRLHRLWIPDIASPMLNAASLWAGLLAAVSRRRNQFDVLHVHQALYPAHAAVTAAAHIGKPSVVLITSSGEQFDLKKLARQARPFGMYAANYLVQNASVFIALNDQIAADLETMGVSAQRILHIPNGVEIQSPTEQRVRTLHRKRLNLPTDRSMILSVGNLRPEKNQMILIRAVQELARCGRHCTLIVLGDGPMREALETQAQGGASDAKIVLPGRVNNVLDYLYAADLFVLPSLVEGLSNALIEAMGVGLPCAASDIQGNRMLIRNGINGLLFDPHDAALLKETLCSLLTNPMLASSLGSNARRAIAARYSIAAVADQYASLYRELVHG